VASVDTRDLDSRGRLSSGAARNLDLSARNVELGTTEGRCTVKTDVLNTEEVLSSRGVLGEVEGNLAEVVGLEGKTVVAGLVGTHSEDLEPFTGTVIFRSIAISLGHVDVERTRVLDGGVESETNSVTRGNLVGLGLGTGVEATSIAN
jgi:hypothetical protein